MISRAAVSVPSSSPGAQCAAVAFAMTRRRFCFPSKSHGCSNARASGTSARNSAGFSHRSAWKKRRPRACARPPLAPAVERPDQRRRSRSAQGVVR
eukprot:1320973-Prymnesium_polylepis.1